jgi:hypothetical protein
MKDKAGSLHAIFTDWQSRAARLVHPAVRFLIAESADDAANKSLTLASVRP